MKTSDFMKGVRLAEARINGWPNKDHFIIELSRQKFVCLIPLHAYSYINEE